MKRVVFIAVLMAACWDAWIWYGRRVAASPEEAAPLAAAVALVAALAAMRRHGQHRSSSSPLPLMSATLLLSIYGASQWLLPPIMQCAFAVTVVLLCGYGAATGERPPLAFWGLAALSLPVLPSLQFTLGFPMRAVSAAMTAGLLQMQGLAVTHQGTLLTFRGQAVEFDAPCSGVAMLWAATLAALMAGAVFRLALPRLAAALAFALIATLAGNVLRTASLFYIETGLIQGPAWWHEAIGLAAFGVSVAASLWVTGRLAETVATLRPEAACPA